MGKVMAIASSCRLVVLPGGGQAVTRRHKLREEEEATA
jgi:hypothetical protein